MKIVLNCCSLSFALLVTMVAGCGQDDSTDHAAGSNPTASSGAHAGHAHPTEGPHHGELIELGNEAFHAEILHDEDAGTVTIYLLDSEATELVAIDATEIIINAKHDGLPEQFTLSASPDAGDPPQKSSRFVSQNEELAHHLDEEGAELGLVVSIDGKSYRGSISHDHDHEGHDHEGHDH